MSSSQNATVGEWSEWVWSQEHQSYYCYRVNSGEPNGYEYRYQGAQTQDAAATPRATSLSELTAGIGQLQVGSPQSTSSYLHGSSTGDQDTAYTTSKGKSVASNEPQPQVPPPIVDPFYGARGLAVQQNLYQDPNSLGSWGSETAVQDDGSDLRQAQAESRNQMYGQYTSQGASSSTAYVREDADGDEAITKIDIRGTAGQFEKLDPRYSVQHSWRFQPGMIFKILWPEPSGHSNGTLTMTEKHAVTEHGRHIYVGIRRFIIYATDAGQCSCVPILTYQGRACKKKGVKANKHGIIVSQAQTPKLLSNEPSLGFKPIHAVLSEEGEKLTRESRVNYSKIVSVEHNVKVFFIGQIEDQYMDNFTNNVNRCWADKKRYRKK